MDTKERNRRRRRPSAAQEKAPRRHREETRERRRTTSPEQRRQQREARRSHPKEPPEQTRLIRRPQAAPKREARKLPPIPREELSQAAMAPPRVPTRSRLLLKLGIMAAVVAAIFFGLTLFFRVETIQVAGAEKYTPHMIQQASGVETGDSLLTLREARVASRIISKLPYVDRVKVRILLPGTVQIELTELQVTYAVADTAGQWWLLSASGRVVEPITAQKARDYTRAEGLRIQPAKKGEEARAEGEAPQAQLDALLQIMSALETERIIGRVECIDVSDVKDLKLSYPSLLTVRLGNADRMSHKVRYMAAALEQLAQNISGELDVSLEYTENGIFTPAG